MGAVCRKIRQVALQYVGKSYKAGGHFAGPAVVLLFSGIDLTLELVWA